MAETVYGWDLEMQMRAARAGVRILEAPVYHCSREGGRSKVSGDLTGTLQAIGRLLLTLLCLAPAMKKPSPG
jgi:hypothetical protein